MLNKPIPLVGMVSVKKRHCVSFAGFLNDKEKLFTELRAGTLVDSRQGSPVDNRHSCCLIYEAFQETESIWRPP